MALSVSRWVHRAIFVVPSAFLCRVTIWPPFPRSCERELRSSSPATDHLSAAGLLFQFWPQFAFPSANAVSVGSRSRRIGALALPCHHRLCRRVYKLCISIVRPMRRGTPVQHPARQVLPSQHRAFGLGAMTAALVIVPSHSASVRTASAQGGPGPRVAGGTPAGTGEIPWMVRLSTGSGATTGSSQRPLTASPRTGSTGRVAPVPTYRVTRNTF